MFPQLLLLFLSVAPPPLLLRQTDEAARLAALCPSSMTNDRKALIRAEEDLLDSLQHQRSAELWNALGCTRVHLALIAAKPPGKRVVYAMPANLGWMEGGINALLLGADGDSNPDGIQRLALAGSLALKSNPAPNWLTIDRLAEFVFTQIALKPSLHQDVKAACPRLLLAVSDTATARECLRLTAGPAALPKVSQLTPTINLEVQYFRLWDPGLLIPQALVTYRYHYDGARSSHLFNARSVFETDAEMVAPPCTPPEGKTLGNSAAREVCSVDENFDALPTQEAIQTMWDEATRRWDRQFRSEPLRPSAMLLDMVFTLGAQGYLRFDASIEASAWSIGIRLEKAGSGGRASRDHLVPLAHESLLLSDVVLGTDLSGLRVALGRDTIWVAPDSRIRRDKPLHLYLQVRSDVAIPDAKTTFRIFEKGKAPGDKGSSITLEAQTPVGIGLTSVQKQLGLANLKPGRYEIEVEVQDPSGARVATRRGEFEVVK